MTPPTVTDKDADVAHACIVHHDRSAQWVRTEGPIAGGTLCDECAAIILQRGLTICPLEARTGAPVDDLEAPPVQRWAIDALDDGRRR